MEWVVNLLYLFIVTGWINPSTECTSQLNLPVVWSASQSHYSSLLSRTTSCLTQPFFFFFFYKLSHAILLTWHRFSYFCTFYCKGCSNQLNELISGPSNMKKKGKNKYQLICCLAYLTTTLYFFIHVYPWSIYVLQLNWEWESQSNSRYNTIHWTLPTIVSQYIDFDIQCKTII